MVANGNADTISDIGISNATCYFNHASGDKTVGAEMKYDVSKKAFDC